MNYKKRCEFCEVHDRLMSSSNLKQLFEEVRQGQRAVIKIMNILQSCGEANEDVKSLAGNMGHLKDLQTADHVNVSHGVYVSEHKSTTARYHYSAPTSTILPVSDRESTSDCRRFVQDHFYSEYLGRDFTELVRDVETVPLGKGKQIERQCTPKKSPNIFSFHAGKAVRHLKTRFVEKADVFQLEESSNIDSEDESALDVIWLRKSSHV